MKIMDQMSKGVRPYAILALLVAMLSLPGVFSMPVMDRDEARFAQASSQMLETGDYVVIRFHDELRNKKPVGIYWLQAASVSLFSDAAAREIWAYRLPSLLGAILTACATFWGGTALMSRRAALAGAALAGMTLLVSTEAHIAKSDSAMVGFTTLALACLAQLRHMHAQRIDKPGATTNWSRTAPRAAGVVFWIAMACGILIKGPVTPMTAGLAIIALLMMERRAKWLKPLAWWPGLFAASVIIIPWFVAVQIATEGAFLAEAVGKDMGEKLKTGAEGHAAPPGTHLLGLPLLFWPSTLFLLPGLVLAGLNLVRPAEDMPERSAWQFLLAWVIPVWLVFEIMPTKLVHYTMPAYPALALMSGAAVDAILRGARQTFKSPVFAVARWVSLVLFLVAGLVLAAIMSPWALTALRADAAGDFGIDAERIATIWTTAWKADGAPVWPFALTVLTVGGTIYLSVMKRLEAAFLALIACSCVVGVSLRSIILPNQDWMLATNAAVDALNSVCAMPAGSAHAAPECRDTAAPKLVRAAAYSEPSFVFMMGGKVTLPPTTNARLPARSQERRPAWLLDLGKPNGRQTLAEISAQAAENDRCVRLSRRFVLNYSNGDATELVAAVIEPGECKTALSPPQTSEVEAFKPADIQMPMSDVSPIP